jgi:hypothetical protein
MDEHRPYRDIVSPLIPIKELIKNQLHKQANRIKSKRVNKDIEKDPQEQPPEWNDFIVAIFFFIFFGVLAVRVFFTDTRMMTSDECMEVKQRR